MSKDLKTVSKTRRKAFSEKPKRFVEWTCQFARLNCTRNGFRHPAEVDGNEFASQQFSRQWSDRCGEIHERLCSAIAATCFDHICERWNTLAHLTWKVGMSEPRLMLRPWDARYRISNGAITPSNQIPRVHPSGHPGPYHEIHLDIHHTWPWQARYVDGPATTAPRYNYTLCSVYGNPDLGVQDSGREGSSIKMKSNQITDDKSEIEYLPNNCLTGLTYFTDIHGWSGNLSSLRSSARSTGCLHQVRQLLDPACM